MDFYSINAKLIFLNVPTERNVQKSSNQRAMKSEAFIFKQIPFEGLLCAKYFPQCRGYSGVGSEKSYMLLLFLSDNTAT